MVRWKRSTPGAVTADHHHDAAIATTTSQPIKEEEGVWETMYGSLKRYREEHGNCRADLDASDTELGQWVMSQRRHYVAYAASRESGDKKYNYTTSCMTQERLQKLKELGLDLAASTTVPTSSQTVAAVKVEEEDSREEAPTLPAVSTPSKKQKRTEDELHPEPRRPPKKRKKSPLRMAEMARSSEPEQRDASPQQPEVRTTSVERDATSGERDGVSPALQKPIKGRGDSAWETLMNVAALVPPLPTRTTAPAKKPAPALVAASPGSTTGTPTKRVKSKYGDLEALSNAGESYSSKYRAANNDVVPNQQRWEDMFIRLGIFKEKHNHCRVPNRYPDDPSLGSWVATQRRYFKNKNLPMPADRVKRLTDLGFEWTTKDPRKVPWETRFEGLKAFKEKFGHVDVPHEWEECPQLGFWTANMRQQYRYKQLGKKSSLTDGRIELLNSIGFVWKMQGGRRKKSDPVARPNQNAATSTPLPPPPPPAPVVSHTLTSAMPGPARQLLVDPMTSVRAAAMGVHSGLGAATYIPPPNLGAMKHRAGPGRPMPYYSHAAKL